MLTINDTIQACQGMQLVAKNVLETLQQKPELMKSIYYSEFVERVYMATRQSVIISAITGDRQTAQFTADICDSLGKIADL